MTRPIPIEEMVRQFKTHHRLSHIFRIDKFSLFKKYQIKECESSVFDIGGYKWKLIVYPEGNERENGRGHISFYLEMQNSGSLQSNWQVRIYLRLFILSQVRQTWSTDEGNRVFNASSTRQGTARFMSLQTLHGGQGYLVGDSILLGVEISGLPSGAKIGTAECLTMIDQKPPNNTFTWKIMKFSAFSQFNVHHSDEFLVGDRKWKIQVYPKGHMKGKDNSLSVFLFGDGYINKAPKTKICMKFRLRVLNKINGKHLEHFASYGFPINPNSYGFPTMISLQDLHDPSKGFLVNDTLYVRVEFDVISMTKSC